MKPLDLNEIILNLMPLLHAQAAKNDVSIGLELGNIPDLVMDRNEIRQMLLNLVLNGIDAMPAGGSITIRTQREGEGVILAVQDQGSGIPRGSAEQAVYAVFHHQREWHRTGPAGMLQHRPKAQGQDGGGNQFGRTVFQVIFPQEK